MRKFTLYEDNLTIQITFESHKNSYKIYFTKKAAGNFSFQQRNYQVSFTSESRINFANKYQIAMNKVFNPKLEHDRNYYVAKNQLNCDYYLPDSQVGLADAVLVLSKGLYGMITFADCIPLVLLNKENNAIASIHLGSRSIVKNVISYLIDNWHKNFNLEPDTWFSIIGPSIFYYNYEIQNDFVQFIENNNIRLLNFIHKDNNKIYFDNRTALQYQLKEARVKEIFNLDYDTYSDERFSSYRKEKPKHITQALFVTIN